MKMLWEIKNLIPRLAEVLLRQTDAQLAGRLDDANYWLGYGRTRYNMKNSLPFLSASVRAWEIGCEDGLGDRFLES